MPYDGSRSDDKDVLPTGWRGSTALNSTIKSYEDLAYRVKAQLGYPILDLECSDEQIAIFIDEALEWFTQYSGRERKWIVFCDNVYEEGCGVKLDDIVRTTSMKSECIKSLSSIGVVGTTTTYTPIDSGNIGNLQSAYLSVSPFQYPSSTNENLSAIGQQIILKYDPVNPWDALSICNASCFTVKPSGSDCASLTANTNLSEINFTTLITEYPEISSILDNPTVSSDDDGIIAVSALPCEVLSSIPTEWFDTSAFYPEADLVYFPVTACIEIKDGQGVIYPSCDRSLITCSDLSASWTIDPAFDWVLSSSTISGEDGRVLPLSSANISTANSVVIPGLPSCTTDGSIPLDENGGYYATFHLCNSSIDTNGSWELTNVQFKKSYLPPAGALNSRYCDIQNRGFTIVKTITAYDDCITHTPDWVPVNIVFETKTVSEDIGTIVTNISGGTDQDLNYRRKVIDVFSIDYNMGNGGYFGSNILFSFELGVVANAFGFDLQGNRSLARNGYDMLSYELARGFIDRVRRMVNYVSYEFNPDTQYLKLIPEPFPESVNSLGGAKRCYVVGVYVEKPIEHLINKKWVQEWVRTRVMETVGFIRAKYGTVTLFGGANIAGDSLVSMAEKEKERLLKELREDYFYTEPPMFYIG